MIYLNKQQAGFFLIVFFILSNNGKTQENHYLEKVLHNLEKISSATYLLHTMAYAPGDTTPYINTRFVVKEYDNPNDTTIGASYVELSVTDDSSKFSFCYDGKIRAFVYDEDSLLVIDSFVYQRSPFRPVNPPFFCYAKNILHYILETKDTIRTEIHDEGDSVKIVLTINRNKEQVEFFGKPFYLKNPFSAGNETSGYTIWINKANDLPYKIKREMSHDISVSVIRDVDTNNLNIKDFIPADYFPSGYTIRHYRDRRKNDLDHSSQHKLLGKSAPNWTLLDTDSIPHSLKSYASKVLLIEFTSISCGPCISAVPFLNQLKNDYNRNELDFVSIETFNTNLDAIKMYEKRNRLGYKLLLSTDEVNKKYYIHSTPVFFILDEKRIIKRVFRGYKKGLTDEKIKNVINKMIK